MINYLIALFMFICGIIVVYRYIIEIIKRKKRCTVKAKGVISYCIVSKIYDENIGDTYAYNPVYKYYYNNREYENPSKSENSIKKYPEGKEIDIWINPNNPNEFISKNETSFFHYSKFIFLALLCFLLALVFLR